MRIWSLLLDPDKKPNGKPFPVPISSDDTVSDFAKKVKGLNKSDLMDVDHRQLDVWRCTEQITFQDKDVKVFEDQVRSLFLENKVEGLSVQDVVAKLEFKDKETLLVFLPEEGKRTTKRRKLEQTEEANTVSVRSASPPPPTADMTFRCRTVANLYLRLNELKFLQVCGTPASGKSTLASLLFNHIHKVEGKVPHWISNWPAPGTPAGTPKPEFNQYAKGWTWGDNSVVIIDEAQQTYWDGSLWDDYFKPLCNDPINRENRIIIFSSYGSPNRAMAGGTPWDVPSANRISFHETIPPPGHEPVGLFFTKDEFKDYVSRRTILHQHKFDSQLLDEIFNLTAGHVGAFEEMFRTLVAQDWYRRPQIQTFTVTDFENLNPYDLLGGLEGRSIFSRGLPKAEQLHVPGIANVFNQVLCEGKITTPTPTHPTRLPGGDLGTCFQNGWLHAVRTEDDGVTYIFATPLHRWFVEWQLFGIPQGPNFALLYTSMLEFSFRAFSRFSPTLLSKERLIDSGPPQITQSTPEAQFQHEFYRACFDLSKGQVITFPEFGTAKGRADFYIPSMKWGIELLRNGDRLEEHVCRFNSTGKYGKTLPLTDYIILDCRFSKPIKTHPRLLKMYHVVFTYSNQPGLNRLWTFEILDNNLNLMPGMQGALTNSN